jgi:hypothetical protein
MLVSIRPLSTVLVALALLMQRALSPPVRSLITSVSSVLACRVLGHRHRFRADGRTMTWACERCGGAGGSKTYATADEAALYARGFDREDREDLGRRAPLIAGIGPRIIRMVRLRRARRQA